MSEAAKPDFNPIFGEFVSTEMADTEQLRGLVAYGLYKIAKQEWAVDVYEREKRPPTEGERAAYVRTWTASQVDGKREQAEAALASYANHILSANTPQIEKAALKGSVWRAVGYGIAANTAYTLLLLGLVLILKVSGVDLLGLAERLGPR